MSSRLDDIHEDEVAELAALADGTLTGPRRAALEARVAQDPELAALLAEQRTMADLVRGTAAEVDAPAGLRARIEADRRRVAPRARRRRLTLGFGLAAAVAVAGLLLFALLPSNTPGAPSVVQAAALTLRPAQEPAPGIDPDNPKLLQVSQAGLAFPEWAEKFGWKAVGVRHDKLGTHRTTTVIYEKDGKRLGYTIVDGDPLLVPDNASVVTRENTPVKVFELDGRLVATWKRNGKTCVLSGVGVPKDVLVKLAAWHGKGSVPF